MCHLQSGARYQMDQLWMINYDGRFIDLIKGHVCEAARDEAKCSTTGERSFSLISKQPFAVPAQCRCCVLCQSSRYLITETWRGK